MPQQSLTVKLLEEDITGYLEAITIQGRRATNLELSGYEMGKIGGYSAVKFLGATPTSGIVGYAHCLQTYAAGLALKLSPNTK